MTRLSLAKNGTPRLFYWLLQQRFTGMVHLSQLKGLPDAKIWVHEGLPWFTDITHSSSLLGELMLRRRWVSESVLHELLLGMAQSRRLLGHLMVERAVIDAPGLGQALAYQCEHKLLHLFEVRDGVAELEPQAKISGLHAGLTQGVNTLHLIMQGIRHHWTVPRIASVWADVQGRSARYRPAFVQYVDHFGLLDTERAAAAQLKDGWNMQMNEQARELLRLCFALYNCDMLELGEPVATRSSAARAPSASFPRSNPAGAAKTNPPPAKPRAEHSRVSKIPSARSGRPKTNVPLKPRASANAQTSRLHRLRQAHAANEQTEPARASASEPQDRGRFIEALEMREALIAKDVHAFALFDLPITASRSQIRSKWRELSRMLHPDVLPKLGLTNMHTRAQSVFAHLSNAYQLLSNAKRRAELKASLESGAGAGQSASDVVRQTLEAEVLVREAERFLKKHQYDKAMDSFGRAKALREDEPEVNAGIAWCDYQLKGRDQSAANGAIALLKPIVDAGTKCANAAYYLGLIYAAQGQRNLAQKAFGRALEINPRLIDAERQLRALSQAKPESGDKGKKRKLFGLG